MYIVCDTAKRLKEISIQTKYYKIQTIRVYHKQSSKDSLSDTVDTKDIRNSKTCSDGYD